MQRRRSRPARRAPRLPTGTRGGLAIASHDSSPESSSRWPRKVLRWGLLLLGCTLVLLVAVPWIVTGPVLRYGLARTEEHLNAPLTLEDVDFGWFSGLTLRGVRLGNPEGFGDQPALELPEMHADVKLAALLLGTLDAEVTLIAPVIRVIRDAQGTVNWNRIVSTGPAQPPGESPRPPAPEPPPRGKPEAPEDLPRVHLSVRDGSVFITDAGAGLHEALTGIQVNVAPADSAGRFELLLRADLQSGEDPHPTGRVEVTALLDPTDPAATQAHLLTQGLDLGHYEPLLPALGVPLDHMRGTVEGTLEVGGTGGSQVLAVHGELKVQGLELAGPALAPRQISIPRGVLKPDCTIDLESGHIDTEHVLADLGFVQLAGLPADASAGLLGAAGAGPFGLSLEANLDALAQQPGWLPASVQHLGGALKVNLAASSPWDPESRGLQPVQWACQGGIDALQLAASFLPESVVLPSQLSLSGSGKVDPAAGSVDVPGLRVVLGETHLATRATRSSDGACQGGMDLQVAPDLVRALLHAYLPEALGSEGPVALHADFQLPEPPDEDPGLLHTATASGSISFPTLSLLENLLSGLQLDFQVAQGKASLETEPGGVLNGGPLTLQADYQLAGTDQDRFQMNLGWKDGQAGGSLAPLLRYAVPLLAGLPFQGLDDLTRLDLKTGLDLQLALGGHCKPRDEQSWLDVVSAWTGNGSLRLMQGSFTPAPAVAELLRYLDSKDRLTFSQLTSKFTIENGTVNGPNIEVRRKGVPLALSGFTRFDGLMNYSLDLTELLRSHKSADRILEALGGQKVAAGLAGTLTSPRLDLGLLEGKSLDSFVEGVLQGLQTDPAGTLDGLLDLLGKKKDRKKDG